MAAERSQKRELTIGALIIIGLITAMAVVTFIPDLVRMARPSIHLVALMSDAGALGKNSPVWLAGRKVGIVTAVEFRPANTDSTRRMAVHLDVQKKFLDHIRKDSDVRITTERLVGEPIVDIQPGSMSAPRIEDNDSLLLRSHGTLEAVMDRALVLTEDFDSLVIHMKGIQGPAAARQHDLDRLNRNLKTVSQQFHAFAVGFESSPMAMLSDPAFGRVMARLSDDARQLREAFAAAAGRARAANSDAQPSLQRLAARADTISRTLNQLKARVTEGGGGLIMRAQKDSAIIKAVHEAQVQIDSLMAETKRNPLRFWF